MIIAERFCGPPGYGNGGYSCGRFAAGLEGPAAVTLRRPVPLETPLERRSAGSGHTIHDPDGELIAEVEPSDPLDGLIPPVRPAPETAAAASRRSPFRSDRHPYPGCFVCGPDHPHGLHLHVGELDGDVEAFAAAVRISGELAADGIVDPAVVWSTLDCPSYVPPYWEGPRVLLGRLTAELLVAAGAEQPLVAVSWPLGTDGRKLHAASALLDAEGVLLARARALWIRLDET